MKFNRAAVHNTRFFSTGSFEFFVFNNMITRFCLHEHDSVKKIIRTSSGSENYKSLELVCVNHVGVPSLGHQHGGHKSQYNK